MKEPKVSIIMPTYNHGDYINNAISSVKNQIYRNWELIIIDNFSTDNTEQIINKAKDHRVIYKKFRNNGAIAASRNYGLRLSKGEIIAFLDSDDEWYPKKLSYCVQELFKQNAGLVYHQMVIKKLGLIPFIKQKTENRKLTHPSYYDLLENGNPIINSSVVMKKCIIESVGYLNEEKDFFAWEDYDYWIRISEKEFKLYLIDKHLGNYLVGKHNTTSSKRTLNINRSILKHYFVNTKKPIWMIYSDLKSYCSLLESRSANSEFKKLLVEKNIPFKLILKSKILIWKSLIRIK